MMDLDRLRRELPAFLSRLERWNGATPPLNELITEGVLFSAALAVHLKDDGRFLPDMAQRMGLPVTYLRTWLLPANAPPPGLAFRFVAVMHSYLTTRFTTDRGGLN